MADGPKISPAEATQTRPDQWPDASAAVPTGIGDGPRTGDRVGRYRVEKRLGAGGMGVVVLARDPELSRQVALKVVRHGIGDRAYRDRLVREARAMAQLDHPNVVRVHDAGDADGEVFVAMEYVPGETLGAWMKAAPRPWREVVKRFIQAGRGLAAAHTAGLVHRDFKPENVLVRAADGRIAVSDFGLAAPVRDAAEDGVTTIPDPPRAADPESSGPVSGDDSTIAMTPPAGAAPVAAAASSPDSPLGAADLTATGAVIGTPAYMAPEQAGGRAIDARADVYSFCVALHEGALGYRPFSIKPLPVGGGFARGPAAPPRDARPVPAALTRALARGLASDPADRWPSMPPLLDALERLLARRGRIAIAATALVVLGGAGLGSFALAGGPAVELCPAPTARLAGVWDPARKAALRDHLVKVDPVQGQARFDAAARAFDAYSDGWSAMHVETCEATRVRGEQSDTLLDLRMTCLNRRFDDFRVSVDLVAAVDSPSTLDRAISRAIGLTPLDRCADTKALSQVLSPPENPADRATSERLMKEAEAIRAEIRAGRFKGLGERAQKVVAEARALNHPPTLMYALLALQWIQRFEDDTRPLETTVRELTQVAANAHDDIQVATSLIDLMLVVGRDQNKPTEALALLPAAEAAVARAGATPGLYVNLRSTESDILAFTPRTDEAIAKGKEAVRYAEITVAQSKPDGRTRRTIDLLRTQHSLGVAQARAGHTEEALAIFNAEVAKYRDLYGGEHPDEANAWEGIGNTLGEAGRATEAVAAFRNLIRIRSERLGETLSLASGLWNLSIELIELKQIDEALATREHALAIRKAKLPPNDPLVATTAGGLATIYDYQGRHAEARRLRDAEIAALDVPNGDREDLATAYLERAEAARATGAYREAIQDLERSEALWKEVRGADSFMLIFTLMRRGQCLIMLGRAREALPLLSRAVALKTPGQGAYEQILARYYRGRAEYETGQDRAGGVAAVAAARVALVNSGDDYKDDVAELDAWLTKASGHHRPARP